MDKNENLEISVTLEVQEMFKNLHMFTTKNKFEYMSIEGMMFVLCDTETVKELLNSLNIDVDEFKENLKINLSSQSRVSVQDGEDYKPNSTIALRDAINLATEMAVPFREGEGRVINVENLFMGIMSQEDSLIKEYFEDRQVDLLAIKRYFTHKSNKSTNTDRQTRSNETKESSNSENSNSKLVALNKFGVNLTKKAEKDLIDPVIGRDKEVFEIMNILGQRRKNNPLLVGDAGVGKTTIAEGLALKIKEGKVPEQLKNFEIYSIEVASLMAGAKYRGDLEERIQKIIKEASENPNVVLFIDEIHQIIGSGGSQQNNAEAANILKPALASGAIKVIGATTFKEYREIFQKDAALERRFQKVDVEEPTMEDSLKIIKGIKSKFEKFHKVSYTDDAIAAAVNLSVQYLTDKKLPDKAIDLIDMAGSRIKLTTSSAKKIVNKNDIAQIVSSIAKIPVGNVTSNDKSKLKDLDKKLKSAVLGQDQAIDEVIKAITISRAGLSLNKEKPIGNFLFTGPTGTGKTELAKQLSQEMGVPLIRFDMSEFGSKHEVARLVGAPPGYVGFNEGGKLTEAVKQKPYSIVLLDELEKAHPDVFNILLQVMDDGRLTDGQGRTIDFKNVILIMTSNLGASVVSKNTIGFTKQDTAEQDRDSVIKKSFAPEFYNRLDGIIQFKPLNKELINKITDNSLNLLSVDLVAKNISAVFTQNAKDEIAEKGFDKEYGARPLQRFIKNNIISKISTEIVHGNLENGGEIIVDFKDGQFQFDITSYNKTLKEKPAVKTRRKKVNV